MTAASLLACGVGLRHHHLLSSELMERKIAELMQRMDQLEASIERASMTTWCEAVSAMKDFTLLDEAIRLGAQWREKANTE